MDSSHRPDGPLKDATTVSIGWKHARVKVSSSSPFVVGALLVLLAAIGVLVFMVKQDGGPRASTAVTTSTVKPAPPSVSDATHDAASIASPPGTVPTDVEQETDKAYGVNLVERTAGSNTPVRKIRQTSHGDHARNSVKL